MTNNAIIAEKLTYRYGDLLAVDQISFSVAEGEVLGFLGPNGAGKTTTVNMLTGQLKPKGGSAKLLGMDVASNVDKVQGEMGVCFEVTNLYEQMTAIENLKLFARLFNVQDFDVEALLKRVGLAGRGKDKVAGYSKGMKQRLMVARSIVNKPRVLFLDEPTSGLDPVSSEGIRDIILEEREHNLKQKYGKRALKAKITTKSGQLEDREVVMDTAQTADAVKELFAKEKVVTVHSEEATLEDIFISITGRGLEG
jgi:ABC-2 type transport system ATP-binding protein